MDHQRQTGLPRRLDMTSEARFLVLDRAEVIMIVQPGLADRHDLVTRSRRKDVLQRQILFFCGVVRMRSGGAEDVRIRLSQRVDLVKTAHPRANRDHRTDALLTRSLDHGIAFGCEIGKIQMAMAVDKH